MTVQEAKANIENLEKHFRNAKRGTALYEVLSVFVTLEDLCIAIKCMEEVEQYRALGTVAELKEAREKQRAKKPIDSGERIPFSYYCPTCKTELSDDGCKYGEKYCFECGQALKWGEEE